MKTVNKSVLILVPPCGNVCQLVTDVAAYPEFLPWCDHAAVVSEDGQGMTAEVGIAFGGIRQVFTTRNEHTPVREVAMQLVNGPFSRLDGQWRFLALGDGSQRACRVELVLNYGFDNATLGNGWSARCSTASPAAWWMRS